MKRLCALFNEATELDKQASAARSDAAAATKSAQLCVGDMQRPIACLKILWADLTADEQHTVSQAETLFNNTYREIDRADREAVATKS